MEQSLQVISRQERLEKWTSRIMACRSNGMTVWAWGRENQVPEKRYYYWQRQLFEAVSRQHHFVQANLCRNHSVAREAGNCPSGDGSLRRYGSGYLQWCRRSCHGNSTAPVKIMLTDFTGADRIYIACGYTDLKCGIDGLASLVQQQFGLGSIANTLFLFCGRRRDRIKALYWEGNGFVLLYKRLESGTFQWPRKKSEARALTPQQYRWLMEALRLARHKQFGASSEKSEDTLTEQRSFLFNEAEVFSAAGKAEASVASDICGCTGPVAIRTSRLFCMSTSRAEERSIRKNSLQDIGHISIWMAMPCIIISQGR